MWVIFPSTRHLTLYARLPTTTGVPMNEPLSTDEAVKLYGNRFLTEDAPQKEFPASGMSSLDAMRLVDEELALEGDPNRNLATFVTTWMEPEAQRIIGEN